MVDAGFYSIQNYTTYSTLSGVKEPKDWVQQAKELGYSHLGLCDKDTLAGLIEFQEACKKEDIHPVLGAEFLVYSATAKEKRQNANKIGVLLLYAKNEEGFKNLISINNYAQDKEGGYYYRPRICLEFLKQHTEGLICISPVVGGVGTKTEKGTTRLTHLNQLVHLIEMFGEDFYVGLNPMIGNDSKYSLANRALADVADIQKTFAFNCHYPRKEEANLYDVVRNMDSKKVKKNLDREVINGYLPSAIDVKMALQQQRYSDAVDIDELYEECSSNLAKIAEDCRYVIPTGEYHMPPVFLETESLEGDIMKFIGEGFKKKLCPDADFDILTDFSQLNPYADCYPFEHVNKGEKTESLEPLSVYIDRIKYEYGVIKDMGFLDYFHIVRDICVNNPERGPARGSSAGSIVSYLLDITKVDPIRHRLLFERFLNPDRKDLPDIDIDFSPRSVGGVEEFLQKKYGEDRVFPITTHSRLKIASAIKNIARAYAYTIPDNNGEIVSYDNWSLDRQVEVPYVRQTARGQEELEERLQFSNFEKFYKKHSNWFDNVVMPLQETIDNDGIHAAGYIISHDEPNKCLPIQYNSKNKKFVTQWKDRHCELAGFPKFDILTIKTLDVINDAKELIKKRHGIEVPDIDQIPLDDEKTLDIFRQCKTDGIFQAGTFSQKQFFGSLRPDRFEDIVAANALIRPGPMLAGTHLDYADVKNGKKKLEYDHEDLEPILNHTRGFLIYQESMMQIVQKIGGLTGAESEYVRKACGKKKIEEMKKWEEVFVSGALERGYDEDFVRPLWKKIEDFAEYSFNLSHSVSYSLISYYQAYIKARWPVEFWSAVLRHSSNDVKKDNSAYAMKAVAVLEGIDFVYPSIEHFVEDFEPVDDHTIAWPLSRIKGCGATTVKELCKDGRRSFESMQQMYEDCNNRVVSKRAFDALIKAGFFDPVCKPWEAAKIYYQDIRKEAVPYDLDHRNLFRWYKVRNEAYSMIVEPWKAVAPFHRGVQYYPGTTLSKIKDDTEVFVGGYISSMKIKQTKRGDWFASATLEDEGEQIRVYFWSSFWENEQLDMEGRRPNVGQLVELIGVKRSFNDSPQVSVNGPGNYVRIVWDEENFVEED